MNKTVGIVLIVACAVLTLAVIGLSVALFQKPRFAQTNGKNPYIMFDNKTAQTCWSGAPQFPWSSYPAVGQTAPKDGWEKLTAAAEATNNPPHLPFCKDL